MAVPVVPKGARITGAKLDEVVAWMTLKYEGGASLRSLADQLGRSYGFVHYALDHAGVPRRPRGGARAGAGRPRRARVGTLSGGAVVGTE